MRKKKDEQAEIKAAEERLAKFCRPGSQCKNNHDPERFRRWREGQENAPRSVSWAELGRTRNALW